ncbi:MAG: hypothetical protein HXN40_08915 [Prevotella histicola]|jgi:hypothetical protein|uniref:Bromo domain-containing protein n=1 Tax=Prevotella histicola JCM 15637 = DNF00424 TaxID=1236504 RepID=A0AAW3FCT3_9BACT|nr:hypothetical protein [Prevotella histicola]KGF24337.1 hypothetical protein HMPREF2132_13015 [Prevotella histicola JCM 15637 = DNF00424]MBF1401048.1 hypothetical protein [Prevotella histicola]MBF1416801.1 hypothetical protein [Prevotella histicola]MBF1423683.1 hypothetical protein [Prevotella histicola]
MGIISSIFNRGEKEQAKSGGMEDYMMLVRVYFQSVLASRLGINNLAMLPDLRTYKQTFRVPTLNNKLGLGEKVSVRKTMKNIYKVDDSFFDEIDASIKKNCKKMQDVQPYLYQFQGFTQDLMMLVGNLMKFKLRVPGIFKKVIYTMTEKTVNDIFDKNDFTDPGVIKAVMSIRQYDQRLRFSRKWVTDFVYQIVMLAKKEPKGTEETQSK